LNAPKTRRRRSEPRRARGAFCPGPACPSIKT
jgi:hypothetical protein